MALTTHPSTPRRQPGERSREAGASLVLVLMMITVFGVILAALAAQAETGVRSTSGIRKQRIDQYAAAGAIDGAINYLRADRTRGREGVTCPPFSTSSVNGAVTVSCTPLAGSGDPQAGPNFPAYALMTTAGLGGGYPTGAGISIGGGNNVFRIGGSVYSNSTIDTPKGLDAGVNYAGAFGACNGTITGTPAQCNTGTTNADPGGGFGVEPAAPNAWAPTVTSLPAAAPLPSCNATNKVATMQPGSYFDLNAMTTAFGACTVIWMQPGGYYFDWGIANPATTRWGIARTVIGGTPSGWNPTGGVVQAPTVPGACDPAQPGVQLVFGADSRLDIGGGANVELCASPRATGQQIAIYGRKTNAPGALQSPPAYKPTSAGASSPAALTTPFANVAAIDAVSDTATVTGKKAVGTAVLAGYGLSAIPAGSTLTSVTIRIAHSESNATTNTVSLVAGSKTLCSALAVPSHVALQTDTITCPANQQWLAASDAQLTFGATRPNSNGSTNVSLDGAEVVVTYTPPGLRQQTPGTTIVSMGPGGGNSGKIYVQGSVYAPYATMNLDLKNNNEAGFNRGTVINRFVGSNVPPAQVFSAFNLPGDNSFADRRVALVATVAGRRVIRAVVKFDDSGVEPGASVTTLQWTAVN
jgi:hypothetical protein